METIKAINRCPAIKVEWPSTKEQAMACADGFRSVSTNEAITECVAAVDGYHLQTVTPPKKIVKNVRSYFSGHYQTFKLLVIIVVGSCSLEWVVQE